MTRSLIVEDAGNIDVKTGTPEQVRDYLRGVSAPHVLALTLPEAGKEEAEVVRLAVESLIPLVRKHFKVSQKNTLMKLIDILTPDAPTKTTLREAEMGAAARNIVLSSGDWWTAADICEHAGFSKSNPSAQPSKWKRDQLIFTITHKGTDYFPKYALDKRTFRPLSVMKEIISILAERKDGWGMAVWFEAVNSYLGGKQPKALIWSKPESVVKAAFEEVKAVDHA